MPISHISLLKGKSPEYLRAVSDSLNQALVEAFDVPVTDRFQFFHQHEPYEMSVDPHYMGGPRTEDFMLINVTAGRPRSPAMKEAFFARLVGLLAVSPGVRPEDVMIVIHNTQPEDWSFSGGTQWKLAAPASQQPAPVMEVRA